MAPVGRRGVARRPRWPGAAAGARAPSHAAGGLGLTPVCWNSVLTARKNTHSCSCRAFSRINRSFSSGGALDIARFRRWAVSRACAARKVRASGLLRFRRPARPTPGGLAVAARPLFLIFVFYLESFKYVPAEKMINHPAL